MKKNDMMNKNRAEKKDISLNTKICALTSFLADVSSEMAYPILPLFLTQILGAPTFALALIEGAGEFAVNISNMLAGFYSDRTGKRKPFVIAGYSLSGLIKGFLVFATSWWQVFVIRVVERIGKGIRGAPRDALIALSEHDDTLGKAIGFRKMMDNAGAVVGPLLCSVLLALLLDGSTETTYRVIFAIGFVIALLAVITTFFLQEKKTQPQKTEKIFLTLAQNSEYKNFIISAAVFSIGQFSIMLFILKAGTYASAIFIPIIYLAYNVFYTVFAMPAGHLSDKIGAKKCVVLGWFIFFIVLVGFMFFSNFATMFILFALLGLFMAFNETAPRIFLTEITKKQYTSALGLYNGITGTLSLIANLIAGLLWDIQVVSIPLSFGFAALTTLTSIILFIFFMRR
jgi:MFS family permease